MWNLVLFTSSTVGVGTALGKQLRRKSISVEGGFLKPALVTETVGGALKVVSLAPQAGVARLDISCRGTSGILGLEAIYIQYKARVPSSVAFPLFLHICIYRYHIAR